MAPRLPGEALRLGPTMFDLPGISSNLTSLGSIEEVNRCLRSIPLEESPSVQDVPAESLLGQYLPDLQKLQDVDTFTQYYCSEETTLTAAEVELLTKSDQGKEERVKSAVEAASTRGDEGIQKFIRALRLAVGEGHDLEDEQLLKRLEEATGPQGQQEAKQLGQQDVKAQAKTEDVSSLALAVVHGDVHAVEHLLGLKTTDVNETTEDGSTILQLAVLNGHTNIVSLLLQHKPDVRAVNQDGLGVLHIAALRGFVEIVEQLISAGAEVDAINKDGATPLHLAAAQGHSETVIKLIQEGRANVEAAAQDGATPLHLAAAQGHSETVIKLIQEGRANVEAAAQDGATPLHLAAAQGHSETVIKLIQEGRANVEAAAQDGFTPLHLAALQGHSETVIKLIQEGRANVEAATQDGFTPLHLAALQGHSETVIKLIQEGRANVEAATQDGLTPLHLAAGQGHSETVIKLIQEGRANVEAAAQDGATPLHLAALQGHSETVIKLIQEGRANVEAATQDGFTPLHLAAQQGKSETVIKLIQEGRTNVEAVAQDGATPLHTAAHQGHSETVIKLIQEGRANVEAVGQDGFTPLHLAAQQGQSETVIKLIQEGRANVEAVAQDGATPLHLAAQQGQSETVIKLIQEGRANVEAVAQDGSTPLHTAALQGHSETVIKLIQEGRANVEAADQGGATPLHLAAQQGQSETVIKLIQEGRANVEAVAKDGATPLHLASYQGHSETVIKLIQEGRANMEAVDQLQPTPLDVACVGRQHGTVELLMARVCQNRRLAQREATVLLPHLPYILQVLPTKLLLDRSPVTDYFVILTTLIMDQYFANAIILSRVFSGLSQPFQKFVDVLQKSHPHFADILRRDLEALSAAPLPVGVYGVGTVLTASVSSAAHILSWLEYGIMIEIPKDAVTNEGSITVQPCLSGPFILPEDHELVSPAFIISTTAKFTKPVALSLAHHAKLLTEEDCEEMSFVFSSMRPHLQRDQPMYHLKPVAGGKFRPHSLVGTISLHHFCGGAIARKRKRSGQSGSPPTKKAKEANHYIACLHAPEQFLEEGQAHAVFSVTQDPLHFQIVSEQVDKWFPKEHLIPHLVALEFSDDAVELDIPHSYITIQGYQIIPGRSPCKIRQVDVQLGMCTPTVILRIRWVSFSQGILQCDLDVKGTAETCTFSLLVTHPASTFILANWTTIKERLQEAKEMAYSSQVISQEVQEATDNLTLSDLKTILEKLCQVAYKWKSIGTQLSLEEGVLKNVQYICPLDPQAALQEMVTEWLKRVSLPPTWKALVEALRSKSVGEERLALSIEQKYCMPTADARSPVTVPQAVVPESSVSMSPSYQPQPQQESIPAQPSPKLVSPSPPSTSLQTTSPKRCSLDELDRSVIPKVAHKWFQLGRYLRLERELLRGIKSDNSDDIAKCRDMFTEWLVRPELQPSWEKLIEALKSDVVSATELAAELSEK